jgi:biotin carboxyl carrier protein
MERRFRVTVDGKAYDVTVEDLSEGRNLLYPQPGSMSVPSPAPPAPATPAARSALGQATAPGVGDVVATLGGVVESISVVEGQAVNAGDKVLVLEAMKMNSPMVAPRAGIVARIAVKVGDAVESGQVLATIA